MKTSSDYIKLLMVYLGIIGLIIYLSSCATQKRCYQRFPPQIITKDSVVIKDTTIYRDVAVQVPGDSVTIHDTINCPGLNYEKEVQSGHMKAKVSIHDNQLKVDCKSDSFQLVIKDLKIKIATLEKFHSEVKIVQAPPVIKYRMPALGWWSLLGNLLLLGWIFRKPIIKRLV